MLLKDKITELLKEADYEIINEFFHSEVSNSREWDSEELSAFKDKAQELGISINHVDNYGGEGMGDEYWSVYSFNDGTNTEYVKFDGWYASYHGSDFNEWFFVEPEEVTVTRFSRV